MYGSKKMMHCPAVGNGNGSEINMSVESCESRHDDALFPKCKGGCKYFRKLNNDTKQDFGACIVNDVKQRQDNIDTVLRMMREGNMQKDIAEAIGKSRSIVCLIVKDLKKEKLLPEKLRYRRKYPNGKNKT